MPRFEVFPFKRRQRCLGLIALTNVLAPGEPGQGIIAINDDAVTVQQNRLGGERRADAD